MGSTPEDAILKYEENGCLHEMFAKQAKTTPNRVAVVSGTGSEITFAELDSMTDTLAGYLQHHGVVPDSCVGIYMERCVEYVISYIAILKAGGAYMPLDVTYPIPLLNDIFADAKPTHVITNKTWVSTIKDMAEGIFVFKPDWQSQLDYKVKKVETSLDNLAYIVYSSGTTGKPKGIMCPHRGSVFSYTWRHVAFPFQEGDRVACNVFFVWELLRPLLKGFPLYIIPDTVIYDPSLLSEFISKNKITRILVTPSLLQTLLDAENVDLGLLKSLRAVWFCGEVVTISLLERCAKELSWIRFLNLYSISECHDVATEDLSQYWRDLNEANKRKFAPVGKVVPGGVNVVIMDENLNALPIGVPGEIYVGGPTLAKGYLNRPDLNKTRFIQRKNADGITERLYRTGDWGLIVGNRVLEICGRCDSMVKIRGYSIETQAVESALLDLPDVTATVVLAVGQEGEDKQLVAYVVPQNNVTKKEIRRALKIKLPFYMIPSQFVFLKSIPVLPASGKLDKKALPPVRGRRPTLEKIEILEKERLFASPGKIEEEDGDVPKTETEIMLAEMWGDILKIDVDDVTESFFDLGGHSLLAARLVAKVKEQFKVEISVKELFENSTISELASYIDSLSSGKTQDFSSSSVDLIKAVALNTVKGENLDIQLRSFWRSVRYGNRWNRSKVLLTGVTGFLGTYILNELLERTECFVYCVIRPQPDVRPEERIINRLKFYGLSEKDEEVQKKKLESRVHTLSGDVALANLGLSNEDYEHLCYEVDAIIHAAAHVNLVYPYKALKGTNVNGTRNVLHLARSGKIKPLHYVSTNSVFPNNLKNCPEDETVSEYAERLDDGYSQSKWVAEQIVVNASQIGLPTTIYRIGNISGDQTNAGWNPSDFILLVLRASIDAGCWPDIDWLIEMTPVDFVSRFVVEQCKRPPADNLQINHLINSQHRDSSWLYNQLQSFGYTLERCNFKTWCSRVASLKSENIPAGHSSVVQMLSSVVTANDASLFSYNTTFDVTNTMKRIEALGMNYPQLSPELIQIYLQKLSQNSIITRPCVTSKGGNPLSGKVVLVTGASSGIGKSVVEAFANAGAKVALCARRIQRLNEIVSNLHGKTCRVYKLDVTDKKQFKETAAAIEKDLGPIDIIVNNAGVMYYTHMVNLMEEDWERTIDINCKGVTNGVGAVLTGMVARKSGHIINVSSDAGRRGFAGLAVYSGSKFYIEGFSQALRHEVKEHGIRVTTIQPGNVETELLSHTNDPDALKTYGGNGSTKVLEPKDIAAAIVYAASQPNYVAVNEILVEPRDEPI